MIKVTISKSSYGQPFVTPLDIYITTRSTVSESGLVVTSTQSLTADSDNKRQDYIGLTRETIVEKNPGAISIDTLAVTGEGLFKNYILSLALPNVTAVATV